MKIEDNDNSGVNSGGAGEQGRQGVIGIGLATKIEIVITYGDNVRTFDVTDSPNLNCIINEHYDADGQLDGGVVIECGRIVGHVDPTGPKGTRGSSGTQGMAGARGGRRTVVPNKKMGIDPKRNFKK